MNECIICGRHVQWPQLDEGCRARIRADLRTLVTEYALLDATPGASTGQRVTGTRDAPLPARLDVLNLVGPGADGVSDPHGDQVGDLPPLVWLEQWVRDWRDSGAPGDHLPASTMTELSAWVERRLDWAADEHPAVDEFARELHRQVAALRGANRTGEEREPRQYVGPCPQVADGRQCGTELYRYPRIDFITCTTCGTEWRRGPQWVWLARLIRGEESA